MKRMHLKRARRVAKLTQEELARRVGMTQTAISRLESGKVPPPRVDEDASLTRVLARALGVDDLALTYGKAS